MLKKMRYLTGITAILLAVAVSFLISGKVYAGGDPKPCGENIQYDRGGSNLYIQLEDRSKIDAANAMDDFESPGDSGWYGDNIESVQIDYGVKYLGSKAFYDMPDLKTVYIPDTVEYMGENAFYNCPNLTKIYYYGTEDEWQNFKNRDLTKFSTHKNGALFADDSIVEYMDLGTLIVNEADGSFNVQDEEQKAFKTTMNWLYKTDHIYMSEEPFTPCTQYNLDMNSVDGNLIKGNDIKVSVNSVNDWDLELLSDSNLKGSSNPVVFKNYSNESAVFSDWTYYSLSSYAFTVGTKYYSGITFVFVQDLGELNIDLTDGMLLLEGADGQLFYEFLDLAGDSYENYCNYMLQPADRLVNYTIITGYYYVDYDQDGYNDFIAYKNANSCSISRLNTDLYELQVSFADLAYNSFLGTMYSIPYYSTVTIRFRDKVDLVEEIPATCEADGQEAYYKSKDNDNIYSDADALVKIEAPVVIPKLGHDWGGWTVVKEPTVDEEGLEERVCKNDPTHKEQKPIDKLPPTPTPEPTPTPTLSATPTPTPSQYPDVEIEPKPERKDQMGIDGTAFSNGASDEAVEKAILNYSSEEDPAGTTYSGLQAKASKVTKTYIKLAWKKVDNAKSYVIYANKCGAKNKYLKLTTIKNNSYKATKVAGSKIKKGTYYKFLIVALDADNNVISTSKTIHAATTGGKVGNDKSVTTKAKKNKVSVKVGKTFKLKAKTKAASKKLKVKKHRAIKYESSDPSKATVSAKGVITGVSKGTCYVYAYAQNGVCAKIKVTVK